jgi:hypothetical protein
LRAGTVNLAKPYTDQIAAGTPGIPFLCVELVTMSGYKAQRFILGRELVDERTEP